MPLYAELTLRADGDVTRVDLRVDAVIDGLHTACWERTTIARATAYQSITESEKWLSVALRRVLEVLGDDDVLVVDAVDDAEAAVKETRPLPVIPGAPLA